MFCRDRNPTPPGGFTNFIQPHLSPNFHFVGGAAQFAPFKAPRTMEDPPSEEELATPHQSVENDTYVNVESDAVELPRTEKRILWTQEEDVRMVSFRLSVHFHDNVFLFAHYLSSGNANILSFLIDELMATQFNGFKHRCG
jgi:hypothetical protein